MKRFIGALLLAGALGMTPNPKPADAAAVSCLDRVIADCDEDFPADSEQLIAIRGWCYIIRGSFCLF
ncbi:MAG: hypothetical protein HY337_11325 [Gemmatimonadetes bacterium]|jgi:hypothetical protein|nr:hypothetical protein [Gemmatimonadota bacterium]